MSKIKTFFKLFLILFLLLGAKSFAQNLQDIDNLNDSAVSLFAKLKNSDNDNLILSLSFKIDSVLTKIFSNEGTFNYDFSALKKYCSILKSDDGRFNIITWNNFLSTGEFNYFGYIQYKSPKANKFYFYKLRDKSASIEKPQFANLNYKKWYGCIYYEIITKKSRKKTLYTLLGWDGNNFLTNKKIIEVITFPNKKPVFGYSFVINGEKYKRLIFEYNEQASMVLRWNKKLKMIVWDHLAPKEPKYTGMYQFYGPDFTYDGLVFKKKKWNFVDNIVVSNSKEKNKKD